MLWREVDILAVVMLHIKVGQMNEVLGKRMWTDGCRLSHVHISPNRVQELCNVLAKQDKIKLN